ncbi:MAG TPA: SRPBCC family protein [Vicinamibacterales bacterium]|nr:SRPBCC family protein [Vicinamibacterales bacterium]
MTSPRVEVAITIRAPRERVFDAWLDPDRLARFLCAGATHVARIEVDAREGGQFHVVMASDRGEYDHRGQYVEIARPERLRFTWASAATNGVATDVTVSFEEIDQGTRVTLVHIGLPLDAATEYRNGWQSILRKCRDELLVDTPR